MSPKEDNPRKFVTQAQCTKQVKHFTEEMRTIKKALVGDDLRGGMVKEIGEMRAEIKDLKDAVNNQEHKRDLSTKWKIGILGFAVAVATVVAEFIKYARTILT